MSIKQISTMALSVLFIAACSSPEPPPAKPTATFADPLLQQKAKAQAVQGVVDENAARMRANVDNQERGDSPP